MTPTERRVLEAAACNLALQAREKRAAAQAATDEVSRKLLWNEAENLLAAMYAIYDQLAVAVTEPQPA